MSRPAACAVSFAVMVVLVTISYSWLDRPIAFFCHAELHGIRVFPLLTYIPEWFAVLAVLVFVAVGLRALSGHSLSRLETVVLLSGLSLAVAVAIKDQLKFAFGRTWPETWIGNNPSLIQNDVYGFNPFHGGVGYASFPSGHTAAVCAVMSVFWICRPNYRALYALVVLAVIVGLIGADYHFLSDIIAGFYLGATTGWFMVLIWQAGQARPLRSPSTEPS